MVVLEPIFATVLPNLGALAAVAALAVAMLALNGRLRASAMAISLVLLPVLLAVELVSDRDFGGVGSEARLLIVAALLGALAVAALALLFTYRPNAFPILVVAAVPFRVPVGLGSSSASLLVPLYLVVAAGCVTYISKQWRGGVEAENTSNRAIELILLAFILLYALQSLYSADPGKAFDQLVFFYIPFALLFFLLSKIRWSGRLVATCGLVVAGLAALFSCIGFWEFDTRQLFFSSNVIDANEFAAYFRVNSVFFDPNIFGRYLTVAMIVVVTTMLWDIRPKWYGWYALAAAILWGGMVVTLSQSSFGALLLGLAILAGLRWSFKWTAVTIISSLVVGVAFILLLPGAIHLKPKKISSFNNASSGRVELVVGGLKLFGDRPLWGYGSGSFSRQYRAKQKVSAFTAASASHNTPITVAAEQGLIGLALYIVLAVLSFVMLFRGARAPPVGQSSGYLATRVAVAVAFAAVFFHTMIYADFLEDPVVWVLLAVGVGLARQGALAHLSEPGNGKEGVA